MSSFEKNEKRTILISGASKGIGRSITERLIREGHRISIGVRNPDKLKESLLEQNVSVGKRLLLTKYDSCCDSDAKTWVERSVKHFKGFDTIIHCAGIFKNTKLIYKDGEESTINDLIKTNLMGPWMLTRHSWDQLCQNNNSRIIVLVSMSGKRSKGNIAGYSVSKFALMSLCQTIKNEGWKEGIRITAICPGWVNTSMASKVKSIRKEEMTQPDDIAEIVSSLLKLPNNCVPFEIDINCLLEN